MYIKRWLKAGILQQEGIIMDRITGTPQGGVVSSLLSNIFLYAVFDKWMEIHHPEKPFERYADDIVIHCISEKQALFVKSSIRKRMEEYKFIMHQLKTKVVNFRGESAKKYPKKLDFLGFTIRYKWSEPRQD